MNTFNLNLDLDKTSGIIQWVTLRQGDKNGTQLRATIYDHGTPVTGNYTARFSLRHPGTGDTYYRETATYNNGVATVTVDEQYAATVTGITAGYFELLQGSTVIASTADFGVRILASATDGAVPGEVYDSAIEDALEELDEATGSINQMVVDATEEYLNAHPDLTTTVEDNSLTDAKLIQQGGILSRVDRLMYRLDNLLTNTPAEAESVTVTDAASTPVAGLALYGKSTQDGTPTPSAPVPIQSVQGNLVRTDIYKSNSDGIPTAPWADHVVSGITWTRNADGSLTARGTATGNSTCYLLLGTEVPAGVQVALSGCPAGGGASTWRAILCSTDNSNITMLIDNGDGAVGTTSKAANRVRVMVFSGAANVDITFRPMLVVNSQVVPYVPYGDVGLWAKRTSDATQQSVTPVPLDGHTLRSLPDGTRDEVAVDERGHVTLTQRVGGATFDGSETWTMSSSYTNVFSTTSVSSTVVHGLPNSVVNPLRCDHGSAQSVTSIQGGSDGVAIAYSGAIYARLGTFGSASALTTWLTSNPVTIQYPLATPVTYDLGTIDPTALVGPDMTATGIPTAPFALTYERDLNATLARLEAAIATLA